MPDKKLDSFDDSYSKLPPTETIKKYQFIIQDEYNNLYEVGYYDTIDSAISDINDNLKIYNVTVDADMLKSAERNSPFGGGLDLEVYENNDPDEGATIMVRCFVHF